MTEKMRRSQGEKPICLVGKLMKKMLFICRKAESMVQSFVTQKSKNISPLDDNRILVLDARHNTAQETRQEDS